MKHITTWRPDTCGCVLEYEWDDADPLENREHTVKNVVNGCLYHDKTVLTKAELYDTVLDENKRKNQFLKEIMDAQPEITEQQVNDDGSTVTVLKKGVQYDWSFDEDRNLVVGLKGAVLEKSTVSNITSSEFEGKVKLK